ncbi:MSMEG_4193 family putative phosphomutase [Propionibacteriaceae bacterium G1746]|uniref:MSMEG_4193 family putative phosphomutase n=1 Tax=Aestuariimicrobium sp. G57 TaxID=3418485 RepID=UPI003C19166F
MSILIAVRHGRSTSNAAGTLAGRTPGIALDETGVQQAVALGERLRGVTLAAAVTSPMLRCEQTMDLLLDAASSDLTSQIDDRLVETDYGQWSGRLLKDLADEPLWKVVQQRPDEAVFPGGESMLAVRDRVVDAVLDWNRRLAPTDVWVMASHGDPLAALLNWASGAEFRHVQRLGVDPASASIIVLPGEQLPHPRIITMNSVEGSLARWLAPPSEQTVGGSTGTGTPATDD